VLAPVTATWEQIVPGIEIGKFPAVHSGRQTLLIVRLDFTKCALRLLTCAEQGHAALPADQWSQRYGLSVVFNAGMFEPDRSTHTGYVKNADYVKPELWRKEYESVAAWGPQKPNLPYFHIYDTDALDSISADAIPYDVLVQNLRLIKHPGENRWPVPKEPKKWSEIALGEDSSGRGLILFSPERATMHDLNDHLLALPISLVAAQHLEGGPEVSLYIKTADRVVKGIGSYETGFNENDNNRRFWALPNVIGVVARP
jgi:hypothetical protein